MKGVAPTAVALIVGCIAVHAQDWDAQASVIVDAMTTDQATTRLSTPTSGLGDNYGWSAADWRVAITQIQDIHVRTNGNPIIFGLDSLHGADYIKGVIFPHQINVGATFDASFAQRLGQFTGRDTKAAGVNWIFGPCLEPARHKAWPRIMETFGEDPLVVTEMGKAVIEGIQSNNVAACFKHYIGNSASASGKDRDPVALTRHELLNIFMPPFKPPSTPAS
ncbi:Aste57867_19149 [Aphanomyces stellatus]|uniref:beta-glucosidase n=1 Tax=Aphanomyces stellatus TaxID=120398 RepID=A0A485LG59_9STRA|nr:hypothetical protein As57867_019085 [Aphanomyces stellatus]VFT95871.1 Aste57867_19149 [Aphanomyces stellatus]